MLIDFVFVLHQHSLIRGSFFWRHEGSGLELTLSILYHSTLMTSHKEVMPTLGN